MQAPRSDDQVQYIYVLELEELGGYYYVGISSNPEARFIQHLAGNTSVPGAAWTREHKPVGIYDVVTCIHVDDETNKTIELMRNYGREKVRGGIYCSVILPPDQVQHLNDLDNGARGTCYICNQGGHRAANCPQRHTNTDAPHHSKQGQAGRHGAGAPPGQVGIDRENQRHRPRHEAFCIRCRKSIPEDTKRPYCLKCFKVWKSSGGQHNHREIYCHLRGHEADGICFERPICYQHFIGGNSTATVPVVNISLGDNRRRNGRNVSHTVNVIVNGGDSDSDSESDDDDDDSSSCDSDSESDDGY